MTDDKKTTTIELTSDDREHLEYIQAAIGATSTIAAIRYAIRHAADELAMDSLRLARARESAKKMVELDEFLEEFEE